MLMKVLSHPGHGYSKWLVKDTPTQILKACIGKDFVTL